MMHPDDARSRGLTDKTSVRVWNNLGAVIPDATHHGRGTTRCRRLREGFMAGDEFHRPNDQCVGSD